MKKLREAYCWAVNMALLGQSHCSLPLYHSCYQCNLGVSDVWTQGSEDLDRATQTLADFIPGLGNSFCTLFLGTFHNLNLSTSCS